MKKQTSPSSSTPRVRILAGSAIAIGPGKADLLEAIAETGSIAAAARRMHMTYRRAWLGCAAWSGFDSPPLDI
jgi:molybdenum-dependent DNA-binding transcriptional regulator ModE